MDINKIINKYVDKKPIRFHIPGHKGKLSSGRFSSFFAQFSDFSVYDITETDETLNIYDNLQTNELIFKSTAKLFGADITLYSCSGATLAIQAALSATATEGTVICVGDIHVSVENAFALCGIIPVFCSNITEEHFEFYHPSAVFITSEDYYGRLFISQIKIAVELCKKYSVPLICDNSHGSHLAFHDGGCLHPLTLGADIVIDSAHKTLPVLTGGAFLHLKGKVAENWRSMLNSMKVFATTSPSYLIAASLESGAQYMYENQHELKRLLFDVSRSKVTFAEAGCIFYKDLGYNCDPYRITLIAQNAKEIDAQLKNEGIYSEFSNNNHVVLIPSVCNSSEDFDKLIQAATKIKVMPLGKTEALCVRETKDKTRHPAISPHKAYFGKHEIVATKQCAGRISAYPIYHYPPAIPIVHSGERILDEHIPLLLEICKEITVVAEDT